MASVHYIHPDGREEVCIGNDGQSLMKIATSNLVNGIIGECGGDLSCATCHVFVDPQWAARLPAPVAEETDMLEITTEIPTEFSRLSCQIICGPELDGIVVTIPRTQR